MKTLILLKNNLAEVPSVSSKQKKATPHLVGTVLSNLAYYGYAPSKELTQAFIANDAVLTAFWTALEPSLKQITGANKNMDKRSGFIFK